MNDGYITEHGTYQQLLAHGGEFARLDKAFGGMRDDDGSASTSKSSSRTITVGDLKSKSANVERKGAGTGKLEGHLIVRTKYLSIWCLLADAEQVKEKRTTGSVSWSGKIILVCSDRYLLWMLFSISSIPCGCPGLFYRTLGDTICASYANEPDLECIYGTSQIWPCDLRYQLKPNKPIVSLVGGKVSRLEVTTSSCKKSNYAHYASEFHRGNSFYQIMYASLGLAQAAFTFCLCVGKLWFAAQPITSFQRNHHGLHVFLCFRLSPSPCFTQHILCSYVLLCGSFLSILLVVPIFCVPYY